MAHLPQSAAAESVPYLTDAAKVAFPLALVGALVGEFIGGNRGIGYLILSAQFNLDTPLVFACLVSITLLTTAGTGGVMLLERRLLGIGLRGGRHLPNGTRAD